MLQKQENEREHFIRKVELAESEAARRLKEVDAKEAERIEAHNQFKRILAMVEDRETKLRNSEELMEKLRSEVAKWQEEVRRLEDEKKAEADQELKRLKAEYTRLETRNFHEVRQCKQTIAVLQQTLEQARLSNPAINPSENAALLNFSASSSDRDYSAPLGSARPPLLHVRPLWDDEPPDIFASGGESSLARSKGPSLDDRLQSDNTSLSLKKSSRSRRSIRDREQNSGAIDGAQTRHKKVRL
ncbi:unnamed protein product [Gongylonema pulchrum]|uniref:DUF3498 domain containing protein n=1 Tax=Gongylonema pulchrum TaxID=637853 RepID=A0A183ETC7_9BILA|nr:unnamed protein product [Gongylonema pulchrum]